MSYQLGNRESRGTVNMLSVKYGNIGVSTRKDEIAVYDLRTGLSANLQDLLYSAIMEPQEWLQWHEVLFKSTNWARAYQSRYPSGARCLPELRWIGQGFVPCPSVETIPHDYMGIKITNPKNKREVCYLQIARVGKRVNDVYKPFFQAWVRGKDGNRLATHQHLWHVLTCPDYKIEQVETQDIDDIPAFSFLPDIGERGELTEWFDLSENKTCVNPYFTGLYDKKK